MVEPLSITSQLDYYDIICNYLRANNLNDRINILTVQYLNNINVIVHINIIALVVRLISNRIHVIFSLCAVRIIYYRLAFILGQYCAPAKEANRSSENQRIKPTLAEI